VTSAQYNRIPWAGLVLAMPMRDGTIGYAVYQMQGPEGTVTIRYEHERDDFWTMVTKPRVVDRILEVNLSGSLRAWDGARRPYPAQAQPEITRSPLALPRTPLALPPTPG
jgi:hypothetical protein